jgi:hypothetical protein
MINQGHSHAGTNISGGFVLGWLLPNEFVPQSWRIPLAAFLIGVGIALAVLALW